MLQENVLVFKSETLIPVILEAKRQNCSIVLVKDHGIFMMSNYGEINSNGNRSFICYANDFYPEFDDDWYDRAREVMGGDDCVNYFGNDESIFDIVVRDEVDLHVEVTPTHFDLFI